MKLKLLPIVALGALAAGCGSETTADIEAPTEAAEAPSPAAYVMDPGKYAIEGSDGTVYSQTVVNPDGTYADLVTEGNEVGRGTWRDERGLACFDPEGSEPEECYTGGAPGEDGAFEMRGDDGTVQSTVRKVEADATAAPAE